MGARRRTPSSRQIIQQLSPVAAGSSVDTSGFATLSGGHLIPAQTPPNMYQLLHHHRGDVSRVLSCTSSAGRPSKGRLRSKQPKLSPRRRPQAERCTHREPTGASAPTSWISGELALAQSEK